VSTFGDIPAGIETVLLANVSGTEIKVLKHPPDQVNDFPAILVVPESVDPTIHFGGNSFEAVFRLIVLVSSAAAPEGWEALYNMIDPTDNTSIIKALRADHTLDGKVDSSVIDSIENVGRRQWFGGGFYFGFDLLLNTVNSVG